MAQPLAGLGRADDGRHAVDPALAGAGERQDEEPALHDAPITTFSDWSPDAYYNPAIPQHSVRTAGSGIQLKITGASQDRGSYRLQLTP